MGLDLKFDLQDGKVSIFFTKKKVDHLALLCICCVHVLFIMNKSKEV